MNLFELQENLKNFSQDQLVREMRNPTGTAPQYLILSELQRRRRIMNEEQAQMPQQASVAEEAVAAAGMPQGGLAQMAQSMAPQTDMTQNTAAQPVERMSEGGLTGVSPRLTDFMPIGPSSRRASGRGIAITPMQMGQSIYEDYIEEMRRLERERRGSPEGLDLGMTADEVNRRANQGRYDPADASPPTVGARDIAALAGEEPIDLRGEVEFPTIGAGLTSLMNQAPSRELDSVIDGLVGSGVESRFDPTDELRTYMSPAERSRMMLSDPDIIERAAALDLTPEQYISSLSPARQDAALQAAVNRAAMPRVAEDRMMFGETPIGAIQSERTEEPMDETLQRILRNSEAAIARESAIGMTPASTYDEVPFRRAPLAQPDLRDDARAARTAEYIERNLAADAQRMGLDLSGRVPREAPEILPSIPEDINRARFADIPTGMLPASDRIRFGETPVGALPAGEISGVGSQIRALTRRPVPGMGDDADVAAGSAGRAEQRGQGSLDGIFDFEGTLDPRAERSRGIVEAAEEMERFIGSSERAPDFVTMMPEDRPIDLTQTDAEEDGSTSGAGGGGAGGGGAGGTGGGAAAAQASSDDLYEQDKWLALAQFGLGLMSSQAPTLGQAIGEAGSTGIAALRQAREDRQDRLEAAQTRADRLAAAAARAASDEDPYPYRFIDDIDEDIKRYSDANNAIIEALGTGRPPTQADGEIFNQYVNNLAEMQAALVLKRRAMGIE